MRIFEHTKSSGKILERCYAHSQHSPQYIEVVRVCPSTIFSLFSSLLELFSHVGNELLIDNEKVVLRDGVQQLFEVGPITLVYSARKLYDDGWKLVPDSVLGSDLLTLLLLNFGSILCLLLL
jgi:hypothetical protein